MTQNCFFENHYYKDPDIPILFHRDVLTPSDYFPTHWHVGVELLCVLKGTLEIIKESQSYMAEEQEIAVINSNEIHMLHAVGGECVYLCLIADSLLCQEAGIPVDRLRYEPVLKDAKIRQLFFEMEEEADSQQLYSHSMLKCKTVEIYSLLSRMYQYKEVNLREVVYNGKKQEAIKRALLYINNNFRENIRLEDICREAGFSKYYFCHYFKSMTGRSVMDYLNYMRCMYARSCLTAGTFNVVESAIQSGFQNASYFTKVYKRYVGVIPSDDKRTIKEMVWQHGSDSETADI